MHTALAIIIPAILGAAVGLVLGWTLGHRRGWTEARDVIVPRLDALRESTRSEADREQRRTLLTSVRGGRA